MTKWDRLPTEILEIILGKLNLGSYESLEGSDLNAVNKQWFDVYQYLDFKDIHIGGFGYFPVDEGVVKSIMDSTFDPGKLVQRVSFASLPKPYNLDKMDKKTDDLYGLMKKCPNVKHVTFNANWSNKQGYYISFGYFKKILMYAKVWKLRSLPETIEW